MSQEHHHKHNHGHGHIHSHDHSALVTSESLNSAFIIGIVLNMLFVVIEATYGIITGSVGLLSDAGHNLSDVASLVLAMMAFRLARVKYKRSFTYGYRKGTILVSLTNAILLLIAVVFIIKESIEKLLHPVDSASLGSTIIWVATAGIVVNGITAWLFLKDKEKDLNVKGAFLHMAADTLVSIGVVISGIIIKFTGLTIIDPIIGLLIAIIIIISTWSLLSKSVRLAIDGVPSNINIDEVTKQITTVKGVIECHHLHVWGISTTENALTAHIVIDKIEEMESIKEQVKNNLSLMGIAHATLEIESTESHCKKECE